MSHIKAIESKTAPQSMHTACLETGIASELPLPDVLGPQMENFEQVSSDHYQFSLAEGVGAQVWCPELCRTPGLMSGGGWGGPQV